MLAVHWNSKFGGVRSDRSGQNLLFLKLEFWGIPTTPDCFDRLKGVVKDHPCDRRNLVQNEDGPAVVPKSGIMHRISKFVHKYVFQTYLCKQLCCSKLLIGKALEQNFVIFKWETPIFAFISYVRPPWGN